MILSAKGRAELIILEAIIDWYAGDWYVSMDVDIDTDTDNVIDIDTDTQYGKRFGPGGQIGRPSKEWVPETLKQAYHIFNGPPLRPQPRPRTAIATGKDFWETILQRPYYMAPGTQQMTTESSLCPWP